MVVLTFMSSFHLRFPADKETVKDPIRLSGPVLEVSSKTKLLRIYNMKT